MSLVFYYFSALRIVSLASSSRCRISTLTDVELRFDLFRSMLNLHHTTILLFIPCMQRLAICCDAISQIKLTRATQQPIENTKSENGFVFYIACTGPFVHIKPKPASKLSFVKHMPMYREFGLYLLVAAVVVVVVVIWNLRIKRANAPSSNRAEAQNNIQSSIKWIRIDVKCGVMAFYALFYSFESPFLLLPSRISIVQKKILCCSCCWAMACCHFYLTSHFQCHFHILLLLLYCLRDILSSSIFNTQHSMGWMCVSACVCIEYTNMI